MAAPLALNDAVGCDMAALFALNEESRGGGRDALLLRGGAEGGTAVDADV